MNGPDLTDIPTGVLTVLLAIAVTGATKRALGAHAAHPWAKRLLPFVSGAVGLLAGLLPGWLPGDLPARALMGFTVGMAGPGVFAAFKRRGKP